MKIISSVGFFGSGKTTLILATLEQLVTSGTFGSDQLAYLLNDEGQVLDGEAGHRFAQVHAITNGCFTCGDTQDLRDKLNSFEKKGVQLVFMEGFGIAGGYETEAFLKSAPYPFQIVTMLDFSNHQLNLNLYEATIASQIQVATLGVLVTKAPSDMNILTLGDTKVAAFIARHNQGRVPVMLLGKGNPIPSSMLTQALTYFGGPKKPTASKCACTHDHHDHAGHGHHHARNHEHTAHDICLYSYELRPGVTLEEVRAAMLSLGVLRAKGATAGKGFNFVQKDWSVDKDDERRYLTFYSHEAIDTTSVMQMTETTGESFSGKQSYELLRSFNGDRALLLGEINRLAGGIPSEALVTGNGRILITHPEGLQVAKDLSRCPLVKDEQFVKTLNVCLRYWLCALRWLRENESRIDPDQLHINKVELAASISWWVNQYGDSFDEELTLEAKRSRIGTLAAEGALGLRAPNESHDKAYWQCRELETAFKFGIEQGDPLELIETAVEHCKKISMGTTVQGEWAKVTV